MKMPAASLFALLMLAAPPAVAADKLTLLLDWFVNPDHAPLIVADEKGYFAAQNLDVEMVEPADPSLPPKLVAAGKADLAVSYQPQLHVQVDQGLPLIRIGTLVSTPLNSLVVLRDGPIKAIPDLKGKKVGFSVGGFEDALLAQMLKPHGLTLEDITLINVNFSLSPSILSGKVDAVIGAFRNFELNQMDIEGRPGRAFFPEEEGVPVYDELIVVANKSKAADDRYPPFHPRGRAGHPIPDQPPRRILETVHRHEQETERRTQPAGVAGYAAPIRPAAGGRRHRTLRTVRPISEGSGPDQIGTADSGIRDRTQVGSHCLVPAKPLIFGGVRAAEPLSAAQINTETEAGA